MEFIFRVMKHQKRYCGVKRRISNHYLYQAGRQVRQGIEGIEGIEGIKMEAEASQEANLK